eukprot:TRINITY_DN2442_c2_g1_i1.p1 TRINITY_DN2442_c2_g1~~TRINITY_DN2442_c2_g1_i1.p1  ORF type:complete len:231 (+),score=50.91 TRINITY_DN2442_c2_g1_i1:32-724(+)
MSPELGDCLRQFITDIGEEQAAAPKRTTTVTRKGEGVYYEERQEGNSRCGSGAGLVHAKPLPRPKGVIYDNGIPAAGCSSPLFLGEEAKMHRLVASDHSKHMPSSHPIDYKPRTAPPIEEPFFPADNTTGLHRSHRTMSYEKKYHTTPITSMNPPRDEYDDECSDFFHSVERSPGRGFEPTPITKTKPKPPVRVTRSTDPDLPHGGRAQRCSNNILPMYSDTSVRAGWRI